MLTEPPLVSVVIPTFNYGQYVTDAVESALAQTYPRVEVIVVDDGSTDDTRDRLAPYGERIRYIFQENQGLSAARNTGILAAKGAYIAFLDSDDAFHPRKLEIQMAVFGKQRAIGLLGTGQINDEPPVWVVFSPEEVTLTSISLEDIVVASRFPPSSAVARRECFEQAGLFDTGLFSVEDRDMWIRIGARYPIALVKEPLTWYRMTAGSMSRNPERMEQYERIVLDRAFRMPELAHRRGLRRKALAHAFFSFAYMYGASNRRWRAVERLLRSFLWFPWLRRQDVRIAFARPRLLAVTLLRILRLKPPEFSLPNTARR